MHMQVHLALVESCLATLGSSFAFCLADFALIVSFLNYLLIFFLNFRSSTLSKFPAIWYSMENSDVEKLMIKFMWPYKTC